LSLDSTVILLPCFNYSRINPSTAAIHNHYHYYSNQLTDHVCPAILSAAEKIPTSEIHSCLPPSTPQDDRSLLTPSSEKRTKILQKSKFSSQTALHWTMVTVIRHGIVSTRKSAATVLFHVRGQNIFGAKILSVWSGQPCGTVYQQQSVTWIICIFKANSNHILACGLVIKYLMPFR